MNESWPVVLSELSGTAYSVCYCVQFTVVVSSAINHENRAIDAGRS